MQTDRVLLYRFKKTKLLQWYLKRKKEILMDGVPASLIPNLDIDPLSIYIPGYEAKFPDEWVPIVIGINFKNEFFLLPKELVFLKYVPEEQSARIFWTYSKMVSEEDILSYLNRNVGKETIKRLLIYVHDYLVAELMKYMIINNIEEYSDMDPIMRAMYQIARFILDKLDDPSIEDLDLVLTYILSLEIDPF